jgi:hypothetical protein
MQYLNEILAMFVLHLGMKFAIEYKYVSLEWLRTFSREVERKVKMQLYLSNVTVIK